MLRKCIVLLALGLVVLLSGCVSAQFSGLQFGIDTSDYEVVQDFESRVVILEFLGGPAGLNLFNVTADRSDMATKNLISNEISAAGGDGARDIKIVHKATIWHLLISYFSLNIVAPSAIEVSGTIISE